jgi:hypothetical protein
MIAGDLFVAVLSEDVMLRHGHALVVLGLEASRSQQGAEGPEVLGTFGLEFFGPCLAEGAFQLENPLGEPPRQEFPGRRAEREVVAVHVQQR